MTTLNNRTVLFGHTDEDSAYVVDDYPYGYAAKTAVAFGKPHRLRTKIRYWIETTKRGDRFCAQTLNPKTGRWNKPKKSTYLAVMVLTRNEDDGHIRYNGIDYNDKAEWINTFVTATKPNLSAAQLEKVADVIGYTRAMEHVTWEIRPTASMTADEIAEADRQQEQAKEGLAKLIAVKTIGARKELA